MRILVGKVLTAGRPQGIAPTMLRSTLRSPIVHSRGDPLWSPCGLCTNLMGILLVRSMNMWYPSSYNLMGNCSGLIDGSKPLAAYQQWSSQHAVHGSLVPLYLTLQGRSSLH